MRIQERHSIRGASAIAHELSSLREIEEAISEIIRTRRDSWVEPKKSFLSSLACRGWATNCVLERQLKITLSAVKGRTALAFQTGNIARAAYDILKLGGLYGSGSLDAAVFVAPMQEINGSGNKTFFERVSREAEFLTSSFEMPLLILGIND